VVVRLWVIVLGEIVLAGGICLGVVYAARAGNMLPQAGASGLPAPELVPIAPPRAALEPPRFEPAPPRVPVASDAAGIFLGVKDELLLERMRQGEIVKAKLNKGGSSLSMRVEFADGSRAAFKPEQIHPQTVPRKEVAAYRLNRLLGLNAVPPAVSRSVHRDELVNALPPELASQAARIDAEAVFDEDGFTRGELSYWIPVIVDSHLDTLDNVLLWWRWLTIGEEIPADKVDTMAQLSSLLLFDELTNNSDRFSGGNLMMSPDRKTLYWMDNTFGFQTDPDGNLRCRTYLFRAQKFGRKMVDALRRLDEPSLKQALAPEPGVLSDEELKAVLSRRDVALRHVDGLIKQYGEDKVLVFP
jgi:hypothetical protein